MSFLSDGMCDVMSSKFSIDPKPVAYREGYQPSFRDEASASGAFFEIQSRTNDSWSDLFAKTRPLNNVFWSASSSSHGSSNVTSSYPVPTI